MMTSHWWLRPGWTETSQQLAWHVLFEDQPALREVAARYQRAVTGVAGLDLVPLRWLHMTIQNVGFASQVGGNQLDAVVAEVRARLGRVPSVDLTFTAPQVQREGITLSPTPSSNLRTVHRVLREAVAEVLGVDGRPDSGDFWPHVSLAYANATTPSAPAVAALRQAPASPCTIHVQRVSLIRLRRQDRRYTWTRLCDVPLWTPP